MGSHHATQIDRIARVNRFAPMLFKLLTGISLILCVTASVFWVLSLGRSFDIHWGKWHRGAGFYSCRMASLVAVDGYICLGLSHTSYISPA